jgi:hypothetical protein
MLHACSPVFKEGSPARLIPWPARNVLGNKAVFKDAVCSWYCFNKFLLAATAQNLRQMTIRLTARDDQKEITTA